MSNSADKNVESEKFEASPAMRVNIVHPLEDADFRYARWVCDDTSGWQLAYERKQTRVWTKAAPTNIAIRCETQDNNKDNDATKFKMIKMQSEFPNVSAETAYDVLHDTQFRKKWDKYMLSSVPIGYLDANNDICYYSLGSLPPFRNRDFVMQRSWLNTDNEKYICGHSVWHDQFPPNKTHVRGIIYFTVYFVRRRGNGCEVVYVTHSDPKGKLPSWLINRLTTIIAPRVVKKLHKACLKYPKWKEKHNPQYKPWLLQDEKIDYPRIKMEDCCPKNLNVVENELIDESNVAEQLTKGVKNDSSGEESEDNV